MSAITLLSATTSSATSGTYTASERNGTIPATVVVSNLSGAEAVTVEVTPDEGVTWIQLYSQGNPVTLTASSNTMTLYGPGKYRFQKPVTVSASAIYVLSNTRY